MNYALILKAIAETMELLRKVAKSRDMDGEELERYIGTQRQIREELVRHLTADPDDFSSVENFFRSEDDAPETPSDEG